MFNIKIFLFPQEWFAKELFFGCGSGHIQAASGWFGLWMGDKTFVWP